MIRKSFFWLFVIFRGQHFDNGLGEAFYLEIVVNILIHYRDMLQLKPVCFGNLKAVLLRIADIDKELSIFLDEIGGHLGVWLFL